MTEEKGVIVIERTETETTETKIEKKKGREKRDAAKIKRAKRAARESVVGNETLLKRIIVSKMIWVKIIERSLKVKNQS